MRPFKTPSYIFLLGGIFNIGLITLFFYISPANPYFGMNHFFLMILIAFMFFPAARKTLPLAEESQIKCCRWISQILLIQSGFIFLFLSVCAQLVRIQDLLNSYASVDIKFISNLFINFSLETLPWTMITLFAVMMGYFSVCKNKPSNIASTLSPLLRQYTPTRVGAMFDLFVRQGISATVSLTLTIFLLGSVEFIANSLGTSIFQKFSFLHVLALWGVGLFFYSKRWRSILSFFIKRRTSIGFFYILYITMITIGLPLFVLLLTFIFQPFEHILTPLSQQGHNILNRFFVNKEWMWFMFSFLLGWTPILGSALIRLSKGYKIWQMVLASMLLPTVIWISFHYTDASIIPNILIFLKTNPLISLLPLFLFYYFFKDIPHLHHLFYGYVNKKSIEKYRSPLNYLKIFPNLLLYCIFIMVVLGYKFFLLTNIAFTVIIFLIFNLMLFSFITELFQPRAKV